MHLINQIAPETPHEWTRSDVQGPAMKTQVIESPKALPISYNESFSKDGAPPLLETPMVRPPSLLVPVAVKNPPALM
jgi:hypothetical protein